MQLARAEPRNLDELVRQIRAHTNFPLLTREAVDRFEGAAILLDSVGKREYRVWCRKLWRHLHLGAACPGSLEHANGAAPLRKGAAKAESAAGGAPSKISPPTFAITPPSPPLPGEPEPEPGPTRPQGAVDCSEDEAVCASWLSERTGRCPPSTGRRPPPRLDDERKRKPVQCGAPAGRLSPGVNYRLPPPTEEQAAAVARFAAANLVVWSVAGSGKTTLILMLAARYAELTFLVLTYNRHLREETKEKIEALGLGNVEVRTYHGFAGDLVRRRGRIRDDVDLRKTLSEEYGPFRWDVCVIDEVQDMVEPYYSLVVKATAGHPSLHWVLLGDHQQCVYYFQGADFRYLTLAHRIFPLGRFARVNLSLSHRVTAENATLINAMCKSERIVATRRGPKPLLIICDVWKGIPIVAEAIRDLVAAYAVKEVLVLAPNLKRPYSDIADYIASGTGGFKIPVFLKRGERGDAEVDAGLLENKLLFSSYNSAKGTERKAVVILGFDDGLYRFKARTCGGEIPTECPLPLYVALTRASERLVLVESPSPSARRFAFLPEPIANYCEVRRYGLGGENSSDANHPEMKAVHELLKGKGAETLEEARGYIREEVVRVAGAALETKARVEGKAEGTVEAASDIIGVLVPLACACRVVPNAAEIYRRLAEAERKRSDAKSTRRHILDEAQRALRVSWEHLDTRESQIKAAMALHAAQCGTVERIFQIKAPGEIVGEEMLAALVNRLRTVVAEGGRVETPVSRVYKHIYPSGLVKPVEIYGAVDWVDAAVGAKVVTIRIYEIKCAQKLDACDRLQLALYAALFSPERFLSKFGARADHDKELRCEYYLYNVRTDELIRLFIASADLSRVVALLLREPEERAGDEGFVERALQKARSCGAEIEVGKNQVAEPESR